MATAHEKRTMLRTILAAPTGEVAPGIFDVLSARLAERAGFRVITISGSGTHHAQGFGDVGLLTLTEQVARAALVADSVALPIVADCEVAGTNANVARAVHEYERAGVAAVDLEDEEIPARAGAGKEQEWLSHEAFIDRIKAAVDSREDPAFAIVARMESRGEPYERIVERAVSAVDVGADALWIGHLTEEQRGRIARDVPRPMLGVVTRPRLPATFLALGYRIAIVPNTAARAACWGMDLALRALRETGSDDAFYDSYPAAREMGMWFESLGGGPVHEV